MNLYKKFSLVFITLAALTLIPILGYTYNSYFTLGVSGGLGYTATGQNIDDKGDNKLNYGIYLDTTYRFSEYFSGGFELHYTHALTIKSTEYKDLWSGIGRIDYIGLLLVINLHLLDDWLEFSAGVGAAFGVGSNKRNDFLFMVGVGTEIPVYKKVLYVPLMFRTEFILATRIMYKTEFLFGFRYKFR